MFASRMSSRVILTIIFPNSHSLLLQFVLQDILRKSTVSLRIEVRPKYLVPDTNCFIDFLDQLRSICKAHPLYQLIVPLVGKSAHSLSHTHSRTGYVHILCIDKTLMRKRTRTSLVCAPKAFRMCALVRAIDVTVLRAHALQCSRRSPKLHISSIIFFCFHRFSVCVCV